MCSVQLGSQVYWLVSGERLERAVSVTVGHDLADEGSGEGEGGCSPVEPVTRWLGVARDFARDEGKSEWGCVGERRPNWSTSRCRAAWWRGQCIKMWCTLSRGAGRLALHAACVHGGSPLLAAGCTDAPAWEGGWL